MPTGSLKLHLTDLLDEPLVGSIDMDLEPVQNSPGGSIMEVGLLNENAGQFLIGEIECRGGPGTLYSFRIATDKFQPYAFFQLIQADRVNTASDGQVRLVVNPTRVRGIVAPPFDSLSERAKTFLEAEKMNGKAGALLYDTLAPLHKACLLNIFTKAKRSSTLGFFRSLIELRQDRFFCTVDLGLPEFLRKSEQFKSAPNALHKPLRDFALEESFKSRDAHANIQFTFMRHIVTGALAADVDIDEASGIEHGLEIIRNRLTRSQTNPYLIRELMLLADPVEKTVDPGYRFLFA